VATPAGRVATGPFETAGFSPLASAASAACQLLNGADGSKAEGLVLLVTASAAVTSDAETALEQARQQVLPIGCDRAYP
jgi:hypothetical protein